jgi:excisionase family DNA binding protein
MSKEIFGKIAEVLELQGQLLNELAKLVSYLRIKTEQEEEYISIREASRRWGVSEPVIRREIQTGRIPAIRVGKKYLVPISALSRLSKLND